MKENKTMVKEVEPKKCGECSKPLNGAVVRVLEASLNFTPFKSIEIVATDIYFPCAIKVLQHPNGPPRQGMGFVALG